MTKKSILIVDDIPGYLEILELYLPSGMEICKVSGLKEALSALAERDFDLALVDIRLNEDDPHNKDGLEFLKWSRANRPGMNVIMISAYREFEYEAESLANGANAFIHKPVNPTELIRAVEMGMARREVGRDQDLESSGGLRH